MERESFEDEATAQLMNDHFISIKVDREERPDVDGLYMSAVVAQTGQGGWPMTVFLLPDGRPFYGGTYFPPEARGGLPSFRQVLEGIHEAYSERRELVEHQAAEMAASLQEGRLGRPPTGFQLKEATLLDALLTLRGQHDERNGGFGRAPKFPPHSVLTFLLRMHRRSGSEEALAMALRTLRRMADGGIHDQLGGGFHRYAVDAIWLVPHFEQMLYDNALLARSYLAAWQVTGDEQWREVAEGILDYLLRELALEHGGFASAQDADTDGVEGATFTWTPAQLRAVLSPEDAELAEKTWGVTEEGNFEGATVLSVVAAPEDDADRERLARVRETLLAARAARPQPALDDKALASWNGMALAALAEGRAPLPAAGSARGRRALRRVPARPAVAPGRRSLADAPRRPQPGAGIPGRLRAGRASGCTSSTWRRGTTATWASRGASRCWRSSASALRTARSTTPRTMPSSSSRARASSTTTRRRRATRRWPGCSCGSRARTASPSSSGARRRSSIRSGRCWRVRPRASATCSASATRCSRPRARPPWWARPDDPATAELTTALLDPYEPDLAVAFGDGTDARGVPLLEGRGLVGGKAAVYVCSGFVCAAPATDAHMVRTALLNANPT